MEPPNPDDVRWEESRRTVAMKSQFEILTIAVLGIATALVLSMAFATASDAMAPRAEIVVSTD